MYTIIQKIYEKNNKILKEGLKKVLNGEDVSSLTGAIKDFTDILGKELFSEIVTQIENLVFDDSKRKNQYESVRFAEKSLITKNGKTKFERRYYKDNETGQNVCLTDKILGLEKDERIDKKVKAEVIRKANDVSYNKSGKFLVPNIEISATTVMHNVRKNEWKVEIEEDEKLGRTTKRLENRLKKIKDTKTYLMNQWQGIEAHDIYKDKLTGCCQEGQVHHTLSERLSTDAKVWSEEGIDEMSQLRAFTQNGGDVYQKIIDISTEEKREKKIQELEKRIRKKANKKIFGSLGAKIPISKARDELYLELKKIWYGNVA